MSATKQENFPNLKLIPHKEKFTYQNPYAEQQPPFGKLPQIILPLLAPQVPSIVVPPVPTPPIGLIIGSPPAHPLWHPLDRLQCSRVEPQNLQGMTF